MGWWTQWAGRVGVAALGVTAACGGDDEAAAAPSGSGSSGDPAAATYTYYRDVAPILARCAGCHQDGQIAPFALDTYESAGPMARAIVAAVESGEMPPFYARETDECDPPLAWANDPRLGEHEIAILRTWADEDAPAGDPSTATPVGPLAAPGLDRVDQELVRSHATVIDGTSDQFQCVVFDPRLAADTWIDGIHLHADNTRVAHHALTYKMTRAAADALSGGKEVYECFGGGGELVHAWAPGGRPFDLPEGVGIPMGQDDVFVVQMHYHPSGQPEQDASSLQLRFATREPEWQLRVLLKGNAKDADEGLQPGASDGGSPTFRIPANAAAHVEEMQVPLGSKKLAGEAPLLFVAGHMHYVGSDIKISIVPEGGEETCMLQVPGWDFNWQSFYRFDAPIDELPKVRSDDVVKLRCTYDNSMGNDALKGALESQGEDAPVDVGLGEETLDEMCIGVLGILLPADFDG